MKFSSEAVERAIYELGKLPGVGRKSAQRIVFFLLRSSEEEVSALANALLEIKSKVKYCSIFQRQILVQYVQMTIETDISFVWLKRQMMS